MRLLMIGDSWGCGEYSRNPDNTANIISHRGTEDYLRAAGHLVKNMSCPADNNLRQLRLADAELHKRPYDHIIWFQTEPLRNIYEFTPFPEPQDHWQYDLRKHAPAYDPMVEEWFRMTYDKAQEVSDRHSIKLITIGGMVPLHPVILNYSFHDILTWSWAEDIVGHRPPYNSYWHTGRFTEDNIDLLDNKQMYDEIRKCRVYEDIQEACERFSCRHPDRRCHEELSERLLARISK